MNCIPLEISSVIPRLNWSPRRLTHRLCSGHSHLFPTLVFMACATAWATADKLPGVAPAWPCFARVTVANPRFVWRRCLSARVERSGRSPKVSQGRQWRSR